MSQDIQSKIFGVSIIMSQWEPYMVGDKKSDDKKKNPTWYNIIGDFDEMRISIEEDLDKFSLESSYKYLSERNTKEERMEYHPEAHKLFLYVKEPGCNNSEPNYDNDKKTMTKREILEKYSKGEGKPFIALVAIKLRHQFIDELRKCDSCGCIEDFLRKEGSLKIEENDLCAMRSLGVDDVYVLIGADSPDIILNCVYLLQNFVCDFDCGEKSKLDIAVVAEKSLKMLEELKNSKQSLGECINDDDQQKHSFKDIIENCIKDVKEVKTKRLPFVLEDKEERQSINKVTESLRKAFDEENVPFAVKNWLLKCINAMRACGPMPCVLQTHTIIGYNFKTKLLDGFELPDEPIGFEMRIRLCPGASGNEFVKEFKELIRPMGIGENVHMVLGRHDCLWQAKEITIKNLIDFYVNIFDNWDKRFVFIQCSNGRFFLDENRNEENTAKNEDAVINMKLRMLEEDKCLAKTWVDEQQEMATTLFRKINHKYGKEFPYLDAIIDEVSLLHIQGCKRFFYALTWNEFRAARCFFWAFFKKLECEFEQLEEKQKKDIDRKYYALMINQSMGRFRDLMSGLFRDRMILDMALRENTRAGTYAMGAYEALLRQYNKWIDDLRKLLGKLEDMHLKNMPLELQGQAEQSKETTVEDLFFLLVPIEGDVIHSHILFPLSKDGRTLVMYRATFKSMIDFRNALPMFVHEVGHYLGIVNRKDRIETYLAMLSYFLVMRVTRELCVCSYSPIPTDIVRELTEDIFMAMEEYFLLRLTEMRNNPETSRISYYLDHLQHECIKWYSDFQEALMNVSGCTYPDKLSKLVKKVFSLYDALNVTPLMAKKSRLYDALSDDIMELALSDCKMYIKEIYADLLMIQILNLSEDDYFDVFIAALKMRDEKMTAEKPDKPMVANIEGSLAPIDAIRAISAIMYIKSAAKNFEGFKATIKGIPSAVTERMECLRKKFGELGDSGQNLIEAMGILVESRTGGKTHKLDSLYNGEPLVLWRFALAPHLHKTGKEINKLLEKLKESKEPDDDKYKSILERVRKLYNEIKGWENDEMGERESMKQLLVLLGEMGGEV